MANNNLRLELLLKLSNVASLLTMEQKLALQWQFELTDLAALAKMIPALAESAKLGLKQSAMALGFHGYNLFLSQIRANKPEFEPGKKMDFKPELEFKAEIPKPRPMIRPRLVPEFYPRPGY